MQNYNNLLVFVATNRSRLIVQVDKNRMYRIALTSVASEVTQAINLPYDFLPPLNRIGV